MKKVFTICTILILVAIAGVFYFAQNEKVAQNEVTKDLIANEIAPEASTQIKAVSDEKEKIAQNEEVKVDTSNWKTYTNEEYGFSVKYPEEWIGVWKSIKFGTSFSIYPNLCNSDKGVTKHCTAAVTIAPFMPFISGYYTEESPESSKKIISSDTKQFTFAERKSVMYNSMWRDYKRLVIDKDDSFCTPNKKDFSLQFAILDVPENWVQGSVNMFINCYEPKQAPIIREILKSIKFL